MQIPVCHDAATWSYWYFTFAATLGMYRICRWWVLGAIAMMRESKRREAV